MGSDKSPYGQGYERGQKEAGKVPSTAQIIQEAVIPGTLPSEKGEEYKRGYDDAKADHRRK